MHIAGVGCHTLLGHWTLMEDDTATWAGTTVGSAGICGSTGGIGGVKHFAHGFLSETGRLTYFASSQICMYI